ncbi:multidrug ABC transporter ATPase [Aneurinibacillus migulanus]|uniref:ABC-2 type transport system ATP-binding protein n=1 Tax=Aneurinibacillus migulanus TaxID=47500 RepID=A0A0D1WEM7_ANEMI|nr:ABC transporter ATP-binding protein [Aneurinibacillus migulanus]KIV56249.1 multidrug ABC transporter ATPase [Aneurinibacillus migulanus]KIV56975.1 multidrug ABC transporter ATPase [Aneurinibacillus migulanus]KON84318.1 multidrug ABC transporter ATPase [Aneurinibacillus migulanus]KPD05243.1 multidrug ABC transporter ATPase [Aneurinibacillus migulanus]MCP1357159.1 ABC transporter ATP-binding protein [Aneurinibacillus migulanus]
MNEYVIETHQLTKQYDGKAGCRNITLSVPKGVVFGFLGPNGAGKSTFVRTLLGLLVPTGGSGHILGHPIGSVESRQKVGYLPELFRYPDWLTGQQLLESHADLCKIPRSERKNRIASLLERVGLSGRGNEKIRGYSKGMQQRIGLACALLSDPEIVFLDEPTSALDPIGRREVRELMAELRDEGKTIFLNSHLLSEVETVCDHIAIIHRSDLVVQGEWRSLSGVNPQAEITLSPVPDGLWKSLNTIVTEVELLQQEGEKTHWLITLTEEDDIAILVRRLSELGISLYRVVPRIPKLEDVFMYWVNREEAQHSHVDHR